MRRTRAVITGPSAEALRGLIRSRSDLVPGTDIVRVPDGRYAVGVYRRGRRWWLLLPLPVPPAVLALWWTYGAPWWLAALLGIAGAAGLTRLLRT